MRPENVEIDRNQNSLPEQLADHLMQRITDAVYRVGEVMPSERAIGEEFRVSRTVVREALRILVARGIVRVENGRGAIVREVNGELVSLFFARALGQDISAWRDLMIVRRLLEGYNARTVAAVGDSEAVASLQSQLQRMKDAIHKPKIYAGLDIAFHGRIAEFAGNSLIVTLIDSMHESLREIIERSLMELTAEQFVEVHHHHRIIVDAIAAGDPHGAGVAMDNHFDDVLRRLDVAFPTS